MARASASRSGYLGTDRSVWLRCGNDADLGMEASLWMSGGGLQDRNKTNCMGGGRRLRSGLSRPEVENYVVKPKKRLLAQTVPGEDTYISVPFCELRATGRPIVRTGEGGED